MKTIKNHASRALLASLFTLILAITALALPRHAHAVDIQEVTSNGGITALLVEDYTVPLIALQFAFRGGAAQDAEGKAGTAKLVSILLDEGSAGLDSDAMQAKLDANGMSYSFSASADWFSGGIKTLETRQEEAFDLLAMMLGEPRFDADPIERMKTSVTASLQREAKDPSAVAGKALSKSLFGDHPYGRSSDGTIESIAAITRDDLVNYHQNIFARDNLVIGVVGAISPEELGPVLDEVFGGLPEKADLRDIPEAELKIGERVHVDMDVPQTVIRMALPGIKRDDPDFFAAHLANHILGGGSFSSRLYQEVREKRGLVYGVFTYLAALDRAGFVVGGAATGTERAGETIKVMRDELKKMAEKGPTGEELEKARKFVTGSYAISNLDTSNKIASVLVAIQQSDLGIDYIDRRADKLAAVTIEDVREQAERLYDATPTIVTVGQKPTETQ